MELHQKGKLEYLTERAGLYFQEYRPDDISAIRYQFFRAPSLYDGPKTILYTAIGLDEALAFISGVNTGLEEARRRILKDLDIE